MCERIQLKRCIYELNFGYNAKMEVYENSSSDIPQLSKISADGVSKWLNGNF
jgi:hypothetical protein